MKLFIHSLFVLIVSHLYVAPMHGQDLLQSGFTVESGMLSSVEKNGEQPSEVLAEVFTASLFTYEDTIKLYWEVYQQCWNGSNLRIELWRDGVKIYERDYSPVAWGWGWWQRLTFYEGPGKIHNYVLKRWSTAWLCTAYHEFPATGGTDNIRKPTGLTVTNSGSDKYLNMSWNNATSLATYNYDIFRNSEYKGTTANTSYTVNTNPADSATWGVAVNTNWGQSARTVVVGKTLPFIKPNNLSASVDTTVGYVRLNWECNSDYATHFQIFRDDSLRATVPVSQKNYHDYTDGPSGDLYFRYKVRSYNNSWLRSSDYSDTVNGRPAFLRASDGSETGAINVSWTTFPSTIGGTAWTDILLLRDNSQILHFDPGHWVGGTYDVAVVPGILHAYTLNILNGNNLLLSLTDYGFTKANGSISGLVTTPGGSGVKNVEMRAYNSSGSMNEALTLDGYGDYMTAPELDLHSNTVTLEGWINPTGSQNEYTGLLYSRDGNTTAGLHIMNTGELRYNWNNDPSTYYWSSGLIVPESVWSFVALVVEADSATIYLNDTSSVNLTAHGPEEFDGMFNVGRDPYDSSRYFKGSIDEVRIWNVARSGELLQRDRNRILLGSDPGLVAYWRFNQDVSGVAGDYTIEGNHHGTLFGDASGTSDGPSVWHFGNTLSDGSYTVSRIKWEEGTDFTLRPFKEGHGFKGSTFTADSLVLPFTESVHTHVGKNFIDTTAIGITGSVFLASDPPCPAQGVKILLDSTYTGESTDSAGEYSISVPEAGTYTLSVEYPGHGFIPADTQINVQDPVSDLDFLDTTKSILTGLVRGGCDNVLGVADIRIRSGNLGCIDTIIQTDSNGLYGITLPAQEYFVNLEYIGHPDSISILNYFSVDTIDISQGDSIHSYIYHPSPVIQISGLPPIGCGSYEVPILKQEVAYSMKIDLIEQHDGLECPVDSGSVTIADFVGYTNPESTIALESGTAYYQLIPGYPNITGGGVHPHQKMLVVKADVGRYTIYDTVWILVRGQKPREFQFSTVSPEIPLMILRDPPGDQSYSYISSTTSSSVNIGFSFESEVGVGIFSNFKVGGGADVPGLGSTGGWIGGEAEASVGVRSTIDGTQEIKISATEMLKTSDSDVITGSEGDVYMGAALNILYARTDILDYDTAACTVIRDTGIVWNGDGFKTTYLYTESYIINSVIPGLQLLATILNNSGEPVKMDSAEVLLNQIAVWQQVIDFNDSIKVHATPLPAFPDNVSFSAGTSLLEEATVASATTLSIGLNLFIDASVALSIGAKAGDFNEAEGGVKIFVKLDVGVSESTTYELSNTIGFELADDDEDPPGDAFWVSIKGDPVYGTPVFGLISGQSSCPWEHPTLPREGVGMTMNTFVMNDVPPEVPAQFDLYLYNLSQSDETRTYLLSLIQSSNPDGAIISVGGAVLGDDELQFSLPPDVDSAQRATLRVAREAGSVYDYDNLQLHLYSPCDEQIDTTVTFGVHFIKPCSDVSIAQPVMNWIINQGRDSEMVVVVRDYDALNVNMQELKFEYRLQGTGGWTELFSYPRSLLPADSIYYLWDMSALPEGAYDLRASTHCTLGTYFTQIHAGMFDCTAPTPFGSPQPADGSFDVGDEISIEFNENIICLSSNDSNVTMYNVTAGVGVDINIECNGGKVIITPTDMNDLGLGDSILITINSISDLYGNGTSGSMSWGFIVNVVSGVSEGSQAGIPEDYILFQNYPNPFNPEVKIRFGLPKATTVSLTIFDINGRVVMTILNDHLTAGYHEYQFEARDLSSGIYFYRLRTPEYQEIKKMVLMK